MSRLALARPAVRENTVAKAMVSAPEGGGKTETALRMARGLAGPNGDILFFDTERGGRGSLLFADRHDYIHVPWEAPYKPEEIAADILLAGEEYPVIITDSISAFWSCQGGVLDIADQHAAGNNKFAGWKVARPAHRRLVDAIIDTRAHVILCCRAKPDYVQEADPERAGRQRIRALGMQPVQDDFLPAEVDVHFRLDPETHEITVAKSRVEPIPQNTVYAGDRAEDITRAWREWCKGGAPIVDSATSTEIEARMRAIPNDDHRRRSMHLFVAQFGRPRYLRTSRLDEAIALLDTFDAEAGHVGQVAPSEDHLALAPAASARSVRPDSPNPERLAAWVDLSARLGNLLGPEADGFKEWVKDEGLRWKPATRADLNRMIAEARRRYSEAHGGPRQWEAEELDEVHGLLDALRTVPREFEDFESFAFENLADANVPEDWTDDHLTAFSTWIRFGATSDTSSTGENTDDREQHAPAA